jgi:hypothetical protein
MKLRFKLPAGRVVEDSYDRKRLFENRATLSSARDDRNIGEILQGGLHRLPMER